ncbi:MAG: glycosyltransferase [Thermoanaerobaculia bacterium]
MTIKAAFVMSGAGVVTRGAEAFVLDLCRALPSRGVEPTLFCRGPVDVPHERIGAVARDRKWLTAPYSATRLGRKILDTAFLDPINVEWATASLSAARRLYRGRYDVVIMEGGLVGGWIARLVRRFRGAAFVDIAHGLSPKWEGAFARNRPDRTVVFTRSFAEDLEVLAPRATIEVIPHGIDLDFFHPEASQASIELERPICLCVGHVDGHKQVEQALEAVAGLDRGSLVVLGEGPNAARLDRLGVARLGAERYLRRQVDRSELPGWYATADCFTLPSRSEAFGLVYVEALACNTPCVAPDDAVRREVIGEGGVFFPQGDVVAYTEALEIATTEAWGNRPRDRAEQFPFARTADAYAALFKELAA